MPNVLFRPALVYGTQESVYWEKYLKPLLLASSFSHAVLTGEEAWQTGLLSHAKRVFLHTSFTQTSTQDNTVLRTS